jgi:hypothetical protein
MARLTESYNIARQAFARWENAATGASLHPILAACLMRRRCATKLGAKLILVEVTRSGEHLSLILSSPRTSPTVTTYFTNPHHLPHHLRRSHEIALRRGAVCRRVMLTVAA